MTILDDPTFGVSDTRPEPGPVVDEHPEPEGERAGLYLAGLAALAVPSIIVLAFFLPGRTATTSATTIEAPANAPAASLDSADIESAVATEVEGVVETTSSVAEELEPVAADVVPIDLTDLDAEAIEIFVYDETPAENGEFTFALRLKSVSTPDAIDTRLFNVEMEKADGSSMPTSIRFVHDSLPVGSSALATVRTGDIGSDPTFVVITLQDREIGRVLFDVGS